MSEPTYRIVTSYKHDPTYGRPWTGVLMRESDDHSLVALSGKTEEEARERCLEAIAAYSEVAPEGHTYYATEDGEIVPAPEPQSLRA